MSVMKKSPEGSQPVPTSSSNSEEFSQFGKMTTREAMLRVTALVKRMNRNSAEADEKPKKCS